jgi:predicted TIM-barrel fold metal-dependent hydrolase
VIIDAHVNLREKAGVAKPRRDAGDLLRAMDEADVAAAVVFPCPGIASNAFVQEQCAPHADRLVTLYNPGFAAGEETIAAMDRFFADHRPHGVKIHPRFQGVSIDDSRVHEVVAWASEQAVPLVFDCFPHGDSLDDPSKAPLAFHALARRFPQAIIVLAHAGGYRVLDAFMVAKSNPNVILESSFTLGYFAGSSVEQDLAFAMRCLPEDRAIYGSDYPEYEIGDHLQRTRRVLAGMPAERMQAFYAETARRVFQMAV